MASGVDTGDGQTPAGGACRWRGWKALAASRRAAPPPLRRVGVRPAPADLRRCHPPEPGLAADHDRSPLHAGRRDGPGPRPDGFAALDSAPPAVRASPVMSPPSAPWPGSRCIMAAKGGVGPRHHRRRLPGAAGDRVDDCDPQRSEREGRRTSTSCCTPWASSRPAPRPPCGCSARAIHGQLTPEQLIDRYDLACRPVRDLLVDYLRERQPGLDYTTLATLAYLPRPAVLEGPGNPPPRHRLAATWPPTSPPPGNSASRPSRPGQADERGQPGQGAPRGRGAPASITVRAFYLDIAQWAAEDPARWGRWAARCPIRADDIQARKERSRRKSRMDQRTRERLPVLPALVAAVGHGPRKLPPALLAAARDAAPGEAFTAAGQTTAPPRADPRQYPPGSGPRTPPPAPGATSPARKTTRSGPGRPWKSSAQPASGSKS